MITGLEDCARWFNHLENDKRVALIALISGQAIVPQGLTDGELREFENILNTLAKRAADFENAKSFAEALITHGFERTAAETYAEVAVRMAKPYRDARIVKSLSIDKLKAGLDFVINKVLLYRDYRYIPLERFLALCNAEDKEQGLAILRFLKAQIAAVVAREKSPEQLRDTLVSEYGLTEEQANVIVDMTREHLSDLREAYLIQHITDITEWARRQTSVAREHGNGSE